MSKKATPKKDKGKPKKGLLQFGKRNFTFPNGDTYEGEYAVDFEAKEVFRHGMGTYTKSGNGHKYTGKWIEDKLLGLVEISFGKNSKYLGSMSSTPEYTVGNFIFGDKSQLKGDYKKNFSGDEHGVTFYDPNGIEWDHHLSEDGKFLILNYNWVKQDKDKEVGAIDSCESDYVSKNGELE